MPQEPTPSRPASQQVANYELEHQGTELGTGSFAPVPAEPVDFQDGLAYLREHPNDEFLHKYLLNMAGTFGPNLASQLIQAGKDGDPVLLALMYETCILNARLQPLTKEFERTIAKRLTEYTPLIYINWFLQNGLDQKAYWIQALSDNILRHKAIIPSEEWTHPVPFEKEALDGWKNNVVSIKDLKSTAGEKTTQVETAGPSAAETAERALGRLKRIGLQFGNETENPASFSPFALQMPWHMAVRVATGRNCFQLTGLQTSYGKGLCAEGARASCLMEVIERVSSWASFDPDNVLCYKHGHTLVHGRLEDLKKSPTDVLDPNDLRLEVPYENQLLYWMAGERAGKDGLHPVLVPAQQVFLFANLDEVSLTSGLSSTGLASGNTLEEAKLHALLEVIERDCERLAPFVSARCFLLESDEPSVRALLDRAEAQGTQIQFLDMTTELGIPCYKAFIQGPNGEILKGCACHLDGKRAAVSALLEVPYHASWFRPVPGPQGLKTRKHEGLPDYSTGNPVEDLKRLEQLLVANGYGPIYIHLTRKDLDIPVVKAIVPGLEMFADFDAFSSLSLRQFAHYIAVSG